MILSAVLMLNYLEESVAAQKLEDALVKVLKEGQVVTPDLGVTQLQWRWLPKLELN